MRVLALAVLAAALAAGVAVESPGGRAAPARATAAAEVFQGLGTWLDVYDTKLYRTPNLLASRLAARGVAAAWIETANDRSKADVVEAGGARTARRRPPRARDPRGRLVPPRAREHRAGPAAGEGHALVPHAAGRRLRRRGARHRGAPGEGRRETNRENAGAPHDTALRGRRDARRGDHVPAARLRAPPHLVAGLPLDADRLAGGRPRADALHGRRLQGLRRDIRIRRPLAPPSPGRGRGSACPSMRPGESRTG